MNEIVKIEVTMNIAASGYSMSASAILRTLPPLKEAFGPKTWTSLNELKEYCKKNAVIAEVTICEHTGTNYYYGNGGYRYLHDRKFTVG